MSTKKKTGPVEARLREARALIADGSRWCQGVWGVSGSRCALGALCFPTEAGNYLECADLLDEAARRLYGWKNGTFRPIIGVNDAIGHDAVMSCYEWAIDQAEARNL